MSGYRPVIGITIGDPAGTGPEITAKSVGEREIYDICRPVVIGDFNIMADAVKIANVNLGLNPIKYVSEARFEYGFVDLIDLGMVNLAKLRKGEVSAVAGKAAVAYTVKAVEMAKAGGIEALAQAPVNKEAMREAGYPYEGQTQLIQELTGAKKADMTLVLDQMRVLILTRHVSLKEACEQIRKELVLSTLELADESLRSFGIPKPKIAVAALNPHAGERGLFGREEIDEIIPAVEEAKKKGINALGPIPCDEVYPKAKKGAYDLVIAMYHDQGLTPLKVLGYLRVVSLVLGIPIIRTSTGHGTGFKIVKEGRHPDPTSLIQAVKVAAEYAKRRSLQR